MTTTEPTKYRYGMNVKFNQVGTDTKLSEFFPNIEDMMLSSNTFDDFELAVASCNGVVTEVMTSINLALGSDRFIIMSEINPRLSGKVTTSKDWSFSEMAKMWIIDGAKPLTGAIHAVALAQLMEIKEGTPALLQ